MVAAAAAGELRRLNELDLGIEEESRSLDVVPRAPELIEAAQELDGGLIGVHATSRSHRQAERRRPRSVPRAGRGRRHLPDHRRLRWTRSRADEDAAAAQRQAGRYALVDGIPFSLPVNSEQTPALMAVFPIDAERAAELLQGNEVHPLRISGTRGLLVITVVNYEITDIGNYIEFSIAIACTHGERPAPGCSPAC